MVENDIAVLLLASAKAAKKINRKDLERVLRMLTKDDDLPTKILNLLKDDKPSDKLEKITPLRGLTYLLDSNLSKSQYIKTRLLSKEHKADIFPAYNKIRDTKTECRPPAIFMMVNDVSAALPLQELLNHTASRLLLLQTEVLQAVQSIHKNALNLKLQIKWGVDGSSDHARYNQKFENENTENSDANLFATTMVPLRITMNKDSKIIIWNNSTPQSARWCRPIRLHFVKETEEFTNQEIQSVQSEIETLNSLVVTISGMMVIVVYIGCCENNSRGFRVMMRLQKCVFELPSSFTVFQQVQLDTSPSVRSEARHATIFVELLKNTRASSRVSQNCFRINEKNFAASNAVWSTARLVRKLTRTPDRT